MLDLDGANFIDFGASTGGSLTRAAAVLGGSGIGVDISPFKVNKLREGGFKAVLADATSLDIPDNSVRYVTMMHFLEHLPTAELGRAMIDSAVRVASDFVFVLGPNFDDAEYLHDLGFKKYYADWKIHPWHHTVRELCDILKDYGQFRSRVIEFDRIHDSFDMAIHPLKAPPDSGPYEPDKFPRKKFVKFDRKLHRTLAFVIAKNDGVDIDRILLAMMGTMTKWGNPGPIYRD